MQADEAGVEDLGHGALAQAHQALSDSQAAVRAHDAQRGDVAVLDGGVGRVFLHFGEDIADDFGVGGGFGGADDGDKGELGPGEGVVEVVF